MVHAIIPHLVIDACLMLVAAYVLRLGVTLPPSRRQRLALVGGIGLCVGVVALAAMLPFAHA